MAEAMAEEEAAGGAASGGKEAGNSGGYDRKCVFCRIARREEQDTALYRSEYEDIVCFKDIKPGAPHHYLVVPVEHLGNCKTLKTEHVPLVRRMMEIGKAVLQRNNVSDLSDIRLHSSSGDCFSTTSGDREDPSDSLRKRLLFDYMLKVHSVLSIPEERMGFHWPPFCSIAHLHLHVLAPASQLGFLSRLYYRTNSYWFITAEQLLERLQTTNAAS